MSKPLISAEMMVQSREYNRGVRYERNFFKNLRGDDLRAQNFMAHYVIRASVLLS